MSTMSFNFFFVYADSKYYVMCAAIECFELPCTVDEKRAGSL